MNLAQRLWVYQAERFPLLRTVPLLAVFSAASINVSALLAGREAPGLGAYMAGLALALILFFQMRAADEWKDREIDARYRPERPVPRGLVSLRLVLGIAVALIPVGALIAWAVTPGLLWLLAVAWLWLALMTAEFGAADWLRARMVLYLISHMAIMPLIDLLLTGIEWVVGGGPAPALWLFLALSFVNGCVLEIGRKTWAPEDEREGVESYSSLWGPQQAVAVWMGCVAVAAGLLALLGTALGVGLMALVAAVGLGLCMILGLRFRAMPTGRGRLLDTASGFWVLGCYAAAGFLPLLTGGGA